MADGSQKGTKKALWRFEARLEAPEEGLLCDEVAELVFGSQF